MTPVANIARLSTWLYYATSALIFGLPLALIVALGLGWPGNQGIIAAFPDIPAETILNPFKAGLVLALGALGLGVLLAAFQQMRALFDSYRHGEVFTPRAARHIRNIGLWLIALALVGVVVPTLQQLALTYDNPAGRKVLSIALSGDTLSYVLAGGLLVVIGWAMRGAAEAVAENAGFV